MNVSIQLELRIDGTAPTGHASVHDEDPRAFSGWVGLVRVVEELVIENSEPESHSMADPQPSPRSVPRHATMPQASTSETLVSH